MCEPGCWWWTRARLSLGLAAYPRAVSRPPSAGRGEHPPGLGIPEGSVGVPLPLHHHGEYEHVRCPCGFRGRLRPGLQARREGTDTQPLHPWPFTAPLSHQEEGVGLGRGWAVCPTWVPAGPQLGALSESLGGPGRVPRARTGRGRRGDVHRPSGLPLWAAWAPQPEGLARGHEDATAQPPPLPRSEVAWGGRPSGSGWRWASGSGWRTALRLWVEVGGAAAPWHGAVARGSPRARGSTGLPPPLHRSTSP